MMLLLYAAGAAAAVIVIAIPVAWLLAIVGRKYGRDTHADALIKKPTYRFTGQDDALRQRTEKRREHASAIRRQAVRLEASTQDESRARIQLVGGR